MAPSAAVRPLHQADLEAERSARAADLARELDAALAAIASFGQELSDRIEALRSAQADVAARGADLRESYAEAAELLDAEAADLAAAKRAEAEAGVRAALNDMRAGLMRGGEALSPASRRA